MLTSEKRLHSGMCQWGKTLCEILCDSSCLSVHLFIVDVVI